MKKLKAALVMIAAVAAAVAAIVMVTIEHAHAEARREYDALRIAPQPTALPQITAKAAPGQTQAPTPSPTQAPPLSEINSDYIGSMYIDGIDIDYPVVQTDDNHRYLGTSFGGTKSASGAIFMDYRASGGFASDFAIIYGHNMKDGSMFAPLHELRGKDGYTLVVVLPDGSTQVYSIVSVVLTDVKDAAYTMIDGDSDARDAYLRELGIAGGARVLALSTCSDSKDGRLLVFAVQDGTP